MEAKGVIFHALKAAEIKSMNEWSVSEKNRASMSSL